jgi:hypothetical protein
LTIGPGDCAIHSHINQTSLTDSRLYCILIILLGVFWFRWYLRLPGVHYRFSVHFVWLASYTSGGFILFLTALKRKEGEAHTPRHSTCIFLFSPPSDDRLHLSMACRLRFVQRRSRNKPTDGSPAYAIWAFFFFCFFMSRNIGCTGTSPPRLHFFIDDYSPRLAQRYLSNHGVYLGMPLDGANHFKPLKSVRSSKTSYCDSDGTLLSMVVRWVSV